MPATTDDLPPTIAEAAAQLRAGATSSVALVEACLRRIERAEPTIHACRALLAEAALARAREADEALRTHRARGPLFGIPLGIKDLIETRGVVTTAGSRVLEDYVPDTDATVVTRLAQAGAIALCKTNTHEFAFGTFTPPTRNPWDPTRVPGGSSGGSAAGVAAGEFLGALGTDTGGSIRIPAACCGVSGLKPTFGLVSRTGIIPLSWSYDHAGPIAWTVEDCALLLDVLAGFDPADPDSVDVPLPDYSAALARGRTPADAVRGTRIGIATNFFFDVIDPEVEATVRLAVGVFADLGATISEVRVPGNLDALFDDLYRAVQRPEAYVYHADAGWLAQRADRYSPTVRANIEAGATYSAAGYVRAQRARQAFTAGVRALFGEVDALLTPTLAIPAPRAGETDAPLTTGGRELPGGLLRCTLPFNLTGQPALSVPCGFTSGGLPVGLQLVAGHFGEPTLLRLGHAYQRATDWHTRRPAV